MKDGPTQKQEQGAAKEAAGCLRACLCAKGSSAHTGALGRAPHFLLQTAGRRAFAESMDTVPRRSKGSVSPEMEGLSFTLCAWLRAASRGLLWVVPWDPLKWKGELQMDLGQIEGVYTALSIREPSLV